MNPIYATAYEQHKAACDRYDNWYRHPMLAYPFGRPEGMPGHHWVVSWDVMQSLTEAAPLPAPIPNPKTSVGLTKLLFGWPLRVDRDAPPGTLRLVMTRRNVRRP